MVKRTADGTANVEATESGKSLMYTRNKSGPRTVSWGTPNDLGDLPDLTSSLTCTTS